MKNVILYILIIQTFLFFCFLFPLSPVLSGSCPEGQVCLSDPLTTGDAAPVTPQELIGRIINAVLGIVGSIALAMFIYGGFTWMTAAGGAEKVQKGKDILIWAAIGLVVIFASYALVNFVIFTAIKGV